MTQTSVQTLLHLLLTAALRSLLMGLVLLAAHHVMQLRHIRTQRTTWILALVAALAMPALATWPGLRPRTDPHPTPSRTPAPSPLRTLSTPTTFTSAKLTRIPLAPAPAPATAPPTLTHLAQHAHAATTPLLHQTFLHTRSRTLRRALVLYAAIAAILLLRLATSLLFALRLRHRAHRFPLPATADTRISPDLSTPVTIASTVLLPPSATTWTDTKLRIVLAHETAHVRQHDFHLKLLSGLHCALFWFSPFPWWLHRRLANLGEALSDHAALALAPSRATYAQLLLELATTPRAPLASVAMARPGSLRPRIERLLSDQVFDQAFTANRLQSTLAAALVPVALLASTSLIHVQAAERSTTPITLLPPQATNLPAAQPQSPGSPVAPPPDPRNPAAQPVPPVAPLPPAAAVPSITLPSIPPISVPALSIPALSIPAISTHALSIPAMSIPAISTRALSIPAITIPAITISETDTQDETSTPPQHEELHLHSNTNINGTSSFASVNNDESFALITGNGSDVDLWGPHDKAFHDLRKHTSGDLLYFRRGQQAYFSQDPALIAQAKALYAPMQDLGRHQRELGHRQQALGAQQQALGQQMRQIHLPTPDLTRELASLQSATTEIRQLQARGDLDPAKLSELQSQMGEIQGKLGELQGLAAVQQSHLGSQQALLGDQQSQLGEQQSHFGDEQSRLAREAQQQLKPLLDQAIQNGKAQPLH